MIAPLQREPAPAAHRRAPIVAARWAVAAALLGHGPRDGSPARRVSGRVAWAFAAWTLVVAASYFAFFGWWAIVPY